MRITTCKSGLEHDWSGSRDIKQSPGASQITERSVRVGEAKRENSQGRILEVSIALFAEHGLQGVTMRMIATAANVSMPTIYHFYENKDVLYRSVEANLYAAHTETLLAVLHDPGTPKQRLERFTRAILDILLENPDYHRILTRSLIENDHENHAFLVENSLKGVMVELHALLRESGRLLSADTDALFIFASVLGFVTMMPVSNLLATPATSQISLSTNLEKIVDLVTGAILR